MRGHDRSSNRISRRSGRCALFQSRAFRIVSGAIATILLLLVSTAAAGDIHLRGFDKNCGLCHFLQIVLEMSSLVTLLLSAPVTLLLMCLSQATDPRQQCSPCHLSRAPPLQPLGN